MKQALVLLSCWAISGVAYPKEIVVDLEGGGDFASIQDAIDAAADGDSVLVRRGEYVIVRSIDFNRLRDPADPGGRPVKNLTVRSEAGPELTRIQMVPEDPESWYAPPAVAFTNGEDDRSLLDGFWITGGREGGVSMTGHSSPRVRRCIVTGNWGDMGAGVFCGDEAAPTLIDCEITGNISDEWGGGLGLWDRAHPRLVRCKIARNFAYDFGGGVLCNRDAWVALEECIISSNTADRGAGIACWDGGVLLDRSILIGNMARREGGAIYLDLEADVDAVNSVIYGNWAATGGIVHAKDDSDGKFIFCTIAVNEGEPVCTDSSFMFRGCIVGMDDPQDALPCLLLDNCLVGQDPLFERAPVPQFDRFRQIRIDVQAREVPNFFDEYPDLHVRPDSPAIDFGDPVLAPAVDIDGRSRPCGAAPDAGAYESDCPEAFFRRGDVDGSGVVEMTDAVVILTWLFVGGASPTCLDAADVDNSGEIELTDAVYGLSWLFLDGPPPAPPFPGCAEDAGADSLDCRSFAGCGVGSW